MAPIRTLVIVSAGLLIGATAVAPAAAATLDSEGPAETINAAAADPCLGALQAGATDAERVCSDQIAGLRYEGNIGGASAALPGALNNRAMARMRAGDLEGAAADLTEALELAPGAWALYLNRARLALMNGDAASALNDLGRLRELAPNNSAALAAADRNAILAWRMLGNLDAAEAMLAQTLAQENASKLGSGGALNPERPAPAAPAPPPG